jgi:hypothetical protein
MLREPSVNRVAALSQLLRGRYQFYGDNLRCPTWLRIISTSYYVVLKSVSLIVYFGLPAAALWQTYRFAASVAANRGMVQAAGLVAATALGHVAIVDTLYLLEVSSKIWHVGGDVRKENRDKEPVSASPG